MTTDMQQCYPLWAVRACSTGEMDAEVGLIVGWESDDLSSTRRPIVASLGEAQAHPFRGEARDWTNTVETSDKPECRWVERVEIYLTLEEAQRRAPDLFREVNAEHDRRWPEDASSSGGEQ